MNLPFFWSENLAFIQLKKKRKEKIYAFRSSIQEQLHKNPLLGKNNTNEPDHIKYSSTIISRTSFLSQCKLKTDLLWHELWSFSSRYSNGIFPMVINETSDRWTRIWQRRVSTSKYNLISFNYLTVSYMKQEPQTALPGHLWWICLLIYVWII